MFPFAPRRDALAEILATVSRGAHIQRRLIRPRRAFEPKYLDSSSFGLGVNSTRPVRYQSSAAILTKRNGAPERAAVMRLEGDL